jgi:hypothetical protein
MSSRSLFFAALLSFAVSAATLSHAQNPAPTPPMGWNSWDAYGLTIDEADYKANTEVLAGMKQYGWMYSVIDEGWYMEDPFAATMPLRKYVWNKNGLLIPVTSRFPSSANGAGFKPLADWVHAQGLKFGIHIVRGIPRQVVEANLPIEGTSFHAQDAADKTSPCPWDEGNWGVKDNAAGQAYYDSMMKLYAGWGLDYIKVDCISDRPYRITEIKQIAEAIKKSGRTIVLSLSPGPTAVEHAAEVAKYAQLWRITDDHWDGWTFKHEPNAGEYPFGLKDEFARIAAWAPYAKPGAWPDPDMLPEGWLGPHPGKDQARQSNYTHDEQRTEFTLWAVSRSPLIMGANLTRLDAFTRSLMTNTDVLAINQRAVFSHPLEDLPAGFEHVRVWEAAPRTTLCTPRTYAFFNLDDKPVTVSFKWNELVSSQIGRCLISRAHNVWDGSDMKGRAPVEMTLPAHGSSVYTLFIGFSM